MISMAKMGYVNNIEAAHDIIPAVVYHSIQISNKNIHIHIYVYISVSSYARIYVCMFVCMHVCIYVYN